MYFSFFFFNDTATTEIYTLSLHDALPIYGVSFTMLRGIPSKRTATGEVCQLSTIMKNLGHQRINLLKVDIEGAEYELIDRKSTRLNSSHTVISYAVFCLKKKKATTEVHAQ